MCTNPKRIYQTMNFHKPKVSYIASIQMKKEYYHQPRNTYPAPFKCPLLIIPNHPEITTILISCSKILHFGTSHKWNHTVYVL